jgi:hypothetical protein
VSKLDRIYPLRQMPANDAPYHCPVLIAGGVGMRKRDGWVSGMAEPVFSRYLTWEPEWWAAIPQENDPLPSKRKEPAHAPE